MELELKHIVGYLPYKLKCSDGELIGIQDHILWSGVFERNHGADYIPISAIKPILRPLSDLTKEIEVDGEKFIPIEELRIINDTIRFCDDRFMDYDDGKNTNVLHFSFYDVFSDSLSFEEISEIIENLNKWRFDWKDNLIGKGLAIDINTLNK